MFVGREFRMPIPRTRRMTKRLGISRATQLQEVTRLTRYRTRWDAYLGGGIFVWHATTHWYLRLVIHFCRSNPRLPACLLVQMAFLRVKDMWSVETGFAYDTM